MAAVFQGFAEIHVSDESVPRGDETALSPIRSGPSCKESSAARGGLQPSTEHLGLVGKGSQGNCWLECRDQDGGAPETQLPAPPQGVMPAQVPTLMCHRGPFGRTAFTPC